MAWHATCYCCVMLAQWALFHLLTFVSQMVVTCQTTCQITRHVTYRPDISGTYQSRIVCPTQTTLTDSDPRNNKGIRLYTIGVWREGDERLQRERLRNPSDSFREVLLVESLLIFFSPFVRVMKQKTLVRGCEGVDHPTSIQYTQGHPCSHQRRDVSIIEEPDKIMQL
jgi:hypothetical protein